MKLATSTAALLLLALAPLTLADDDLGWHDTAELSFVATSGNSDTQTFGLKNTLQKINERSVFTFKAGAVRSESAPDDFFIWDGTAFTLIDPERVKTAESYLLDARYDREITERFFWYGGLGWVRNRFAGIENRSVATAGVGNIWIDNDDVKFRTNYGVTFTDEEQTSGADDSFAGLRGGWNYENQLSETTKYINDLVLDANLDESDDWRGNMVNAISVKMSERMALKASLEWIYDNMPAVITATPVIDNGGGTPPPATPLRELDELDSVLAVSLVIDF